MGASGYNSQRPDNKVSLTAHHFQKKPCLEPLLVSLEGIMNAEKMGSVPLGKSFLHMLVFRVEVISIALIAALLATVRT